MSVLVSYDSSQSFTTFSQSSEPFDSTSMGSFGTCVGIDNYPIILAQGAAFELSLNSASKQVSYNQIFGSGNSYTLTLTPVFIPTNNIAFMDFTPSGGLVAAKLDLTQMLRTEYTTSGSDTSPVSESSPNITFFVYDSTTLIVQFAYSPISTVISSYNFTVDDINQTITLTLNYTESSNYQLWYKTEDNNFIAGNSITGNTEIVSLDVQNFSITSHSILNKNLSQFSSLDYFRDGFYYKAASIGITGTSDPQNFLALLSVYKYNSTAQQLNYVCQYDVHPFLFTQNSSTAFNNISFFVGQSISGKHKLYFGSSDSTLGNGTPPAPSYMSLVLQFDENTVTVENITDEFVGINQPTWAYKFPEPSPTPSLSQGALPPLTYDQTILQDSPAAYWPLNDGLEDVVNGNDFSLPTTDGLVNLVPDAYGNTIQFADNQTDGYLTLNSEIQNLSSNFSVEIWVNASNVSYYPTIFADSNSQKDFPYLDNFTPVGDFRIWVYGGNDNLSPAWGGYLNNSYHLVITVDSSKNVTFYVDGTMQPIDSSISSGSALTETYSIGIMGSDTFGDQFVGTLGNPAIYQQLIVQFRVAAH